MNRFKYAQAVALLSLPWIEMEAQNNPRNLELDWHTNTSKQLVPLDEFTALMQRDGIPPTDHPQFWDRVQAIEALFMHEPVIVVEIGGEATAYPLSIMMFHEIVNDELGDQSFAVTYCPLCNATLVFDRQLIHGEEKLLLDFGVSGMLRMSDLVV